VLVSVFVPHGREEAKRGMLPQRADIDMHGRESRIQVPSHGDVVEAGQCHVFRDPEAGLPKRTQCADRHGVVSREDRRGPNLALEQLGSRTEA
jgi:hypothetical protein